MTEAIATLGYVLLVAFLIFALSDAIKKQDAERRPPAAEVVLADDAVDYNMAYNGWISEFRRWPDRHLLELHRNLTLGGFESTTARQDGFYGALLSTMDYRKILWRGV